MYVVCNSAYRFDDVHWTLDYNYLTVSPFSLICGSNVSALVLAKSKPAKLQTLTPLDSPAAIAAPRAVVSVIIGRTGETKQHQGNVIPILSNKITYC